MATPRDKGTVVEKINNGNVKVKGTRPQGTQATSKPKKEATKAKPAAEREKLSFTQAQLIEAVKAVGHQASSREISDKLGIANADQGRAYVRSRMAALMKDKKILGIEPEDKSRSTFLYSAPNA